MERARGELLPRAGFAGDENHLGVRREPLNQTEQLLHHRAAPHHAAEFELARDLAFERDDLRPAFELDADVGQDLLEPLDAFEDTTFVQLGQSRR